MIKFIFTIDYEIYGDGHGSLMELIYEPAQKLKKLFDENGKKMVVFVEAAELEQIEASGTDAAIVRVQSQVKSLYAEGNEIGLHLHPQWYNARFIDGQWQLDYDEYNLCRLPKNRIEQIVERSVNYLQRVMAAPEYQPVSFRAGNWLFQPAQPAADVLASHGIRIDSSVFKGGRQRLHGLDYRSAVKNGYAWKFRDDVNVPDTGGSFVEMPIFTRMVPFWQMATAKRVGLSRKASSGRRSIRQRLYRFLDMVRWRHPLKLDFCRMTLSEMTETMDKILKDDQCDPEAMRPIVSIGHTKDLLDLDAVRALITYLDQKKIPVTTLKDIYAHSCCTPLNG